MVSHLLYYQLAVFVLVWLFVILHVAGSRRGTLSEAIRKAYIPLTYGSHRL
jgi:hypothetical protein